MLELRLIGRRLRRKPLPGFAVVLTLSLGIGAVTAAFSALDGVLVQRLPILHQGEIVLAWHVNPARDHLHIPFNPQAFEVAALGMGSLSAVAGVETAGARPILAVWGGGQLMLNHVRVAGDFFGVLGANPALGRLLGEADDRLGATPAVVLGYDAWIGRFGADPSVLGTTIQYGGRSFLIVGVAPKGLDIPMGTDLWATLRGTFPEWAEEEPKGVELDLIGRRAVGVGPSTIASDLQGVLGTDPGISSIYSPLQPVVKSLDDHLFGAYRPVLRLAFFAALLLLLTALVNATLLLLAGGPETVRDHAVFRALGANPSRLRWSSMAEAAILGVGGALGGLGLAWVTLQALLPLAPATFPRLDGISLDARGVGFGVSVALAAILGAGIAVAVGFSTSASGVLAPSLSFGRTGGGARVRKTLAGFQVVMAGVSAIGAGLLIRSVDAMNRLDFGFDPAGLSVVSLSTPYPFFQVPSSYLLGLEQVVQHLEGQRGISSVRPTLTKPLLSGLDVVFRTENQIFSETGRNPYVAVDAVLPGHFQALGMPVTHGRGFESTDNRPDSDPVVVVNEAASSTYWPGEDPLGKRLFGFPDQDSSWRVIGVVPDIRYRDFFELRPAAYFPLGRMGIVPPRGLLVRSSGEGAASVGSAVREAFSEVDPKVQVLGEDRVVDLLRQPGARQRFGAGVLFIFAGVTILLTVLGIYGVFTALVQDREVELAVRTAVGAERGELVLMVLGEVARIAAAAATGGLLVALAGTRLLNSLLFGVSGFDLLTYTGVAVAAILGALLSGLIPALHASRVDPIRALRS